MLEMYEQHITDDNTGGYSNSNSYKFPKSTQQLHLKPAFVIGENRSEKKENDQSARCMGLV